MVITLKRLIILGFVLRLSLLLFSNHIFYPDELYQTLEPAHRLAFGYGTITWDYRFHLRPMLIPTVLSLPLIATKLLHLDSPTFYLPLVKILLAAFSTVLIPAAYYLARLLKAQHSPALLAAFFVAIWYELIYFAPRPLTEILATHLFAVSFICLSGKRPRAFPAAVAATVATLIRPQYVLITGALLLAVRKRRLWYYPTILAGCLTGIAMVGAADYAGYGRFLTSLITNYQLNFASGMSAVFGSQSPTLYVTEFLSTSGGLILILLFGLRQKPVRPLLLLMGGLLLLHSLIPHKEYRFLYVLIPLYVSLLACIIKPKYKKLGIGLVLGASTLGLFHLLPGQSRVYQQTLIFTDPSLQLFQDIGKDPEVCGVYDSTRQWVYAGGYTYLHRSVPIFDIDNPPPKAEQVSHLIALNTQGSIPNYTKMRTTPPFTVYYGGQPTNIAGYALYRRNTPCTPAAKVEYYRSFAPVEDFINAHRNLYHL